jgi:tetratricopeptide (TPR) repeat protein
VRRPILSLSLAANHAVLGPHAWGFQVVNIAIHLAAALLLFGIARRSLIIRGYPALRACWLAFAIAAVWLVHPLQTESVSNIIQRAESQMGFFALLTLYCSIRSWQVSATSGSVAWGAGAVLACALGMGTKEIMLVVPPLVYLFDAILVSRSFIAPLRHRPGFYVALASTWLVLGALISVTLEYSAQDFQPDRLGPYILSQPRVIMHYLRVALWPYPLFHYILGPSFWFHPGVDSWLEWLLWAAPLACIALGVLWAILNRSPIGFLGAWFFLPLLATSLVATHNVIQEHRMYLALAAIVTGVVLAVDTARVRIASRWSPATMISATWALLILTLAAEVYGTRLRNWDYESELTLWAPEDRLVAFSIMSGFALIRGNLRDATEAIETVLQAPLEGPAGEPPLKYRDRALNALGCIRAVESRWEEAQQLFIEALERDASSAIVHNNLGVVLFFRGDRQSARQHLEQAVLLDPRNAAMHFNYGVALLVDGAWDEAEKHLGDKGDWQGGQFEPFLKAVRKFALPEVHRRRTAADELPPLRLAPHIGAPRFDEPLALNYLLIFLFGEQGGATRSSPQNPPSVPAS